MRVATWNINHINKRLDLLVDWLRRTQPDVVALQKLKCPTAPFPSAAVQAAGNSAVVVGHRARAAWPCCLAFTGPCRCRRPAWRRDG